ncbi:glycosyltransferase family 31 protein [Tricladium varicosporioides]|nr:glycosyltransferase family 31 protein [Hymenoscyphus varicosporioides]
MGSSMKAGNRLSPRNSFTRALYLTITCVVLVLYTLRPSSPPKMEVLRPHVNHASNETQRHPYSCLFNGSHLYDLQQRYNLGDSIEYGHRYVRFHRQDIERESITKVDHELFPQGFEQIDINNPPRTTHCLKPLDISVPRSPYPRSVDASDLLFGISTTYDRLTDPETGPMKEWAHWLTDGQGKSNGAGLVLRLIDASQEEIDEATHKMYSLGIDVKVYAAESSIEMAKRYLSLLPALYSDTSIRQRKFLVMCDDDTFYPSMHSLLNRLSEFDSTTDLYIGTLSEDINNIQRHGSQAFGGAGVFFSLSLAEKVAGLFDECSTQEKIDESDTGWGPQGDILLRKCIYEHTDVTLTMIRELHQLDIQGDPAGFYEAGLAPLSLHHFKGGVWHKAHPWEGAQVIHACGEDCFLQRFQFSDDFIISNGFSIAYYPKGVDFNLHQMEKTFGAAPDDYGWNLDFMLGPQRKNLLWTGKKAAWELQESQVQGEGMVRQTYIRKLNDPRWTYGKGGSKMFERDGVLELIWIPS